MYLRRTTSRVSALFGVALVFFAEGCTAVPKNEKVLAGLYLPTLHVRRPSGRAADPLAYPDELAHRADPLPDTRGDCTPVDTLLKDVNWDPLIACLKSMNEVLPPPAGLSQKQLQERSPDYAIVRYKFRREPQPALELIVPEEPGKDPEEDRRIPQCIREILPRIEVPREIIYQSAATPKDDPYCYATRLNVEKDRWFGKWGELNPLALRIDFPLLKLPETKEEMKALLIAWMLAPIWEEKAAVRSLKAYVVPDSVCERCFTEGVRIHPLDPRPPLWPPAY